MCWEILNLERLSIRITGSRVMAILLNSWILPICGASAVERLRSTGLPRLVLTQILQLQTINLPTNKETTPVSDILPG